MKVIAAIVLVVVAPAPILLLTLGAIAADPAPGNASIMLLAVGGGLLMILPIVVGSVAANWKLDFRSPSGRAQHRALLLTYSTMALVGALAIIASSVVGRIPAWVPLAAILVQALFVVLAAVIGDRLRRRAQLARTTPRSEPAGEDLLSRAWLRRKVRQIVLGFAITLVAGALGGVALSLALGESPIDWELAPSLIALAFITASIVCLTAVVPLARASRELVGGGWGAARALGRVVLRGKTEELPVGRDADAVRYARIIAVLLPVQSAQQALLFAGLALQQLPEVLGTTSSVIPGFAIGFMILSVAFIAVIVPIYGRQARRARRYAAEHSDALSERPSTAPTVRWEDLPPPRYGERI
ncbi:hypothetical protein [Naasia lichenicola]|uniref:Uncharacterized protein n=1 Tax=Naasia lichenicola TaxID=2565933 RepID=A0A4S4FSB8_9MICO|nr:hypothetical protein [Naasia lichenicola]THG33188.1 hypothetical protein E6C64_02205 [Naasia lichenicola]